MKNYKMIIAYDGSRYKGWLSQRDSGATIQGKLNLVFSQLEHRRVEVQGSGRTDASNALNMPRIWHWVPI